MTYPGFYRFTGELLQYASTSVYAPNFTLNAADQSEYAYPVDGWYWFDSKSDAESFWGINGATNARWVEFGLSLGANSQLNQWYHSLFTPQTSILHGMVTVGLGQAAQGDPRTFLAAWAQAQGAALVPAELVSGVVALASAYDLPAAFVSGLQSTPTGNPEP